MATSKTCEAKLTRQHSLLLSRRYTLQLTTELWLGPARQRYLGRTSVNSQNSEYLWTDKFRSLHDRNWLQTVVPAVCSKWDSNTERSSSTPLRVQNKVL